eukprot:737472-Amphidinium_carterae.2
MRRLSLICCRAVSIDGFPVLLVEAVPCLLWRLRNVEAIAAVVEAGCHLVLTRPVVIDQCCRIVLSTNTCRMCAQLSLSALSSRS